MNNDFESVREALENESNYEVFLYRDNSGSNREFEDDGFFHVVRNGNRFCFYVVQDEDVPVRVQNRLRRLVDEVLSR